MLAYLDQATEERLWGLDPKSAANWPFGHLHTGFSCNEICAVANDHLPGCIRSL